MTAFGHFLQTEDAFKSGLKPSGLLLLCVHIQTYADRPSHHMLCAYQLLCKVVLEIAPSSECKF